MENDPDPEIVYEFRSNVLKPIPDFLDLKGSLKTNKKPLSNAKMHEMFAKDWAKNAT